MLDLVILSADAESTTVELDTSTLPVPDRKYSCDALEVTSSAIGVRMLLGQRQAVGNGLLAMLVVNMPAEAVAQFAKSIDSAFVSQGKEYVAANAGEVPLSHFSENAEQTVVLTCTYVLAGYTGLAGCMDLYNASPFSVQNMVATKKMALEPVVRVNLATGLLVNLIDALTFAAQEWNWNVQGIRREQSDAGI